MDLVKLINSVLGQVTEELEKARCEVTLVMPPALKENWDGARLDQMLFSLLTNAIKYAPGKTIKRIMKRFFIELRE